MRSQANTKGNASTAANLFDLNWMLERPDDAAWELSQLSLDLPTVDSTEPADNAEVTA
jgi:hypothetical protein